MLLAFKQKLPRVAQREKLRTVLLYASSSQKKTASFKLVKPFGVGNRIYLFWIRPASVLHGVINAHVGAREEHKIIQGRVNAITWCDIMMSIALAWRVDPQSSKSCSRKH